MVAAPEAWLQHPKSMVAAPEFFTLTRDISLRSTRSTQQTKTRLYIPRYPTSRLQKCIKYQEVTIWNQIPPEIQSASSKSFKSKFKKHLLQLQI